MATRKDESTRYFVAQLGNDWVRGFFLTYTQSKLFTISCSHDLSYRPHDTKEGIIERQRLHNTPFELRQTFAYNNEVLCIILKTALNWSADAMQDVHYWNLHPRKIFGASFFRVHESTDI